MKITLGHSPDPDDAFMFFGIASGAVEADGIEFEQVLEDIETLNRRALEGQLDVTAVSIHAYSYLCDRYALLPHGASFGDGYGPMLVSKRELSPDDLGGRRIAIPGKLTSAYLALRLYERRDRWPGASVGERDGSTSRLARGDVSRSPAGARSIGPNPGAGPIGSDRVLPGSTGGGGLPGETEFSAVVVPFDRIPDAVLAGEAEAGLLIHEGQLTYARSGLSKVIDLGAWWKEETGLPLPLGGNAIRKGLGAGTVGTVARALRESIAYGLEHRGEALAYAEKFGRGLDRPLADRFVGMYVNDLTLDYGDRGRAAVRLFLERGRAAGVITVEPKVEFAAEANTSH